MNADTWRKVFDQVLADCHVAMTAKVEAFDAVKQTIDAQPMVKEVVRARDDSELETSYPLLRNIPVIYPRSGAYFMAFPLEVGDFVTILFQDWSLDRFRDSGTEVHPGDVSNHSLAGAVAIPGGVYPTASPIVDTIDGLIVGKDEDVLIKLTAGLIEMGASADTLDFVALAADTLSRLQDIVTAFNSHTHPTGTGPSGPPAALLATPVASVAATKVKAV